MMKVDIEKMAKIFDIPPSCLEECFCWNETKAVAWEKEFDSCKTPSDMRRLCGRYVWAPFYIQAKMFRKWLDLCETLEALIDLHAGCEDVFESMVLRKASKYFRAS